jgi:tetratricopeptide (TPR) repeat protein
MEKDRLRRLIQEAAIAVVFTYALLAGGTLNGLALYEAINVSLVLLGLIGVAWLGWAWWRRQPVAFSSVTAVYIVYLVAYAVATVFSSDPRRSLNALCLTALYALVWLLVSDLIRKGWLPELFTRVMIVVATGVIGLALWQAVSYERDWLAINNGSLIPPVILRPNPLLTHANLVAAFLNLMWPVVLAYLLAGKTWLGRLAAGFWILLAWTVILLTSSRGAWLGTAAAFVVTLGLWWLAGERRRRLSVPRLRFSIKWAAAGAVALLLVIGMGVAAARLLQSPTHGAGFGSRQAFWEAAWKAFLERPLTGLGPDTFATIYLQHVSIPPNELFVRAHSQVMQVLAENGLLGILSGGALLAAVGWASWRRWRAAQVPERRLLAGVVGALAATAVHSLFDTPPVVPVNALVIAVLAAILATQPKPLEQQRGAAGWRLALTLLLLALLGAGVWSQYAYLPYMTGTALANSGNWVAAASELETAVVRDPGHTLYNLASGYVHGVVAEQGDRDALPVAIRRYEIAVEREPGYGLNCANLAALYWQQGDTAAALAAMERAVQAAPAEAAFRLNLGLYREEMGDLARAREAYERALTLRPAWAEAYYWRASDFRRSALEAWQAAQPIQEPQADADKAQAALGAGRYREALSFYDQALASNPQWASGYAGRAEALMELGRYAEATRDARVSAFIGGLEPRAVVWARWTLARIAYRQGDLDTALALGEQALDAYRQQSIFGPGTYGTSIYGWAIFYRVGLRDDVLPQLVTIRFTDREVAWLETVGGWYEEAGDLDSARRLYREALDGAPDAAIAAERLATLDGR